VRDYSVAIEYPERAIIVTAVRMLILAQQTVAARYIEAIVRNKQIGQFCAEERQRIIAWCSRESGEIITRSAPDLRIFA
jgi:hypothetical protein